MEDDDISDNTRILVVTQDQEAINQFKVILSALNCSGHYVTSGEQAFAFLVKLDYDICLIDLDLEENAFDISRRIRREISSDLPIIAISSVFTKELVMKCFNVKINDFYAKPMDAENLYKLLLIWRHKSTSAPNRKRSQS